MRHMTMTDLRIARLLACVLVALPSVAAFADNEDTNNRLTNAARDNRTRLHFDGRVFSGPAWDQLLAEGQTSQFFLIGEEHGIAENPKLVAQLFTTLVAAGYEKLVIEISPPAAELMDAAARVDGIAGLRNLFATPGGEPAFYGMREEAELVAAARAALPDAGNVLWGVDYEVASDRPLLRQLRDMKRPASTDQPLTNLIAASDAAWARYTETGGPQHIFSFSGDPALVAAVRDAWPDAGQKALGILGTLQSTLEINRLWTQGRGFDSNARRAALMRSNFLRHWRGAKQSGNTPKILVKLGGNHVLRGRNMTGTFDLGTLLPEIAAFEGGHSFSVLVLPGTESMVAVLDPSKWRYETRPAKDDYAEGLETLTDAAYADAFTLIDLRALRAMVGENAGEYGSALVRTVHGFDMLLVMSGSTASSELADH
jgi:hypothetical protein